MQPIETSRLRLRGMQPSDLETFQEMLQVPDIACEYDALSVLESDNLLFQIKDRINNPDHAMHPWFLVIEKATNQAIGFFMVRHYSKPIPGCQIYYAIIPSARNKKYATESLQYLIAALKFIYRIPVIFLRGYLENNASRRTATNAGMCVYNGVEYPRYFLAYVADGLEPYDFEQLLHEYRKEKNVEAPKLVRIAQSGTSFFFQS